MIKRRTLRFSDFADDIKKSYTDEELKVIVSRIDKYEKMFDKQTISDKVEKGIDR